MMVRINLLPGKKKRGGGGEGNALVVFMVLLLVAECVFFYFIYDSKQGELDAVNRQVKAQQDRVRQLEIEKAGLPKLKERVEQLKQSQRVLEELTVLRQGPHHVMEELKRILNNPVTQAEKTLAKRQGWDPIWPAQNVYLTNFLDEGGGFVIIQGNARSDGDVAQFLLRLNTSKQFFSNVDLRYTREIKEKDDELGEIVMKAFEITATVNFFYQTEDGVKLLQMLNDPNPDAADGGDPAPVPNN